MKTPGAELHKLIPDFFQTPGCGCTRYSKQMDAWGWEGCWVRFDEIVDYLFGKAREIGYLKVVPDFAMRVVLRRLVRRALDNCLDN